MKSRHGSQALRKHFGVSCLNIVGQHFDPGPDDLTDALDFVVVVVSKHVFFPCSAVTGCFVLHFTRQRNKTAGYAEQEKRSPAEGVEKKERSRRRGACQNALALCFGAIPAQARASFETLVWGYTRQRRSGKMMRSNQAGSFDLQVSLLGTGANSGIAASIYQFPYRGIPANEI
jgi:hypothetical protein